MTLKLTYYYSIIILLFFTHCNQRNKEFNIEFLNHGEINLEVQDDNYVGSVDKMIITDTTVYLLDEELYQILRYDIDGNFVQIVGGRGEGPGEYSYPSIIAIDNHNYLYISDQIKINKYDKNSHYINRINIINADNLLVDNNENLLILHANPGINMIKKVIQTNNKVDFEVALSKIEDSSISMYFNRYKRICYSSTLGAVFYINGYDYQIQKIDLETGEILRVFGEKPPEYSGLKKEYKAIVADGSTASISKVVRKLTFVHDLFIVNDNYLLVGFAKRLDKGITWFVYEIATGKKITEFKNDIFEPYQCRYIHENMLYIYSPPKEEDSETSNGIIYKYEIRVMG